MCPFRTHADALCGIVAALDPDEVLASEAPELWFAFDRIERLAASAKILLARRVDDSGVAQRQGMASAAEYLARKSGTSISGSRGALETSKRITTLGQTQAALRRGELSASQVEPIADAVAHNPGSEHKLLNAASRSNLGELRDECARAKAAGDPEPEVTYRRIHQNRFLRRRRDGEGGWNLAARGAPDAGAFFNSSLDPIIDDIFHRAWAQGRREEREKYAFDALIEMARRARHGYDPDAENAELDALDEGEDVTHGVRGVVVDNRTDERSDTTSHARADGHDAAQSQGTAQARDTGCQPDTAADEAQTQSKRRTRRPGKPTYLALLRIDFDALLRGHIEGEELCEIQGVGPVPVSRAYDLLGDAVVKLIATRGEQVVNVTHYGRQPTVAQRMALLWTSPTCTVEGCNHAFAQFDHRIDWSITYHTKLEELDRLCDRHHKLKTNRGWALVPGTGKRPMVPPEDPRHPDHQRKRNDRPAA
jgi:hypothetical protein